MEREADADMIAVPQRGGGVKRFPQQAIGDALVRTVNRSRAHDAGELDTAPRPHPFVEALMNAPEDALQAMTAEHGTGFLLILGEEEILAGKKERPGPPCEWNDSGTVCR